MGTLYLLPTVLGEDTMDEVIPPYAKEIVKSLNYFIVENTRTTRRFISAMKLDITIDELTFFELNKHTPPDKVTEYLQPLEKGFSVGLISEAGLPGIADPGNEITKLAHIRNIPVKPVTGPSSIFLALMASGMNGQNFAFNGYLPIQKGARVQALKQLEKRSRDENQSQIFMETPYRNNPLVNDILKACQGVTQLCIAANITTKDEFIKTRSINQWKKNMPDLHKRPSIFILQG